MPMQPFAEFRTWLRRASTSEKAMTGAAAGTVLAVLGWVLVPTGAAGNGLGLAGNAAGSTSTGAGLSGGAPGGLPPQQGATGATARGGTVAVPGASGASGIATATRGGTTGAGTDASSAPVGKRRSCPSSSAPGVTSSSIRVAVTMAEIGGAAGNATFGLPTVAEQKAKYNAVIAAVNSSGGVACRKLVPTYYSVNPADQSDMQAKCLDIEQAGVFAVIDDGGEYAGADCFGQRHIPFIGDNLLFAQPAAKFYPYLMSAYNLYDNAYRTMVSGLKQRGFFDRSRGFHKLGFMYFSCHPELISEMTGWFHQAGLADSDIVGYNAGCPSPPLANPSDIQQAILRFKTNDVSHVTFAYFLGSIGSFTSIAQQQDFHPKYGLADDGFIGVSYGSSRPDRTNFDGAITIATSRYGEEHTAGYRATAGTTTCNNLFVKAGITPIYRQPASSNGGWVCDLVWMFRAAVDHAPSLSRNALAAGLLATKSLDFSWPGGPNDFTTAHGVAGADAWRVAQYAGSCGCWKLADPDFHAG